MEQAVSDLEALRETLGLEKWVLLGYSYGGFLAQLYTVRYPERVAGLVLHGAVAGVRADLGDSRQEDFFSSEEKVRKKSILEEGRELRKASDWSARQLPCSFWSTTGASMVIGRGSTSSSPRRSASRSGHCTSGTMMVTSTPS